MKKKLWSGRFKAATDRLVDDFNASIGFDKRLYRHDIDGSIAHAQVLERAGILTPGERKTIASGLKKVRSEMDGGSFDFHSGLEDIHMAVEERLTAIIGPLGGKLHTGRSRNDQVATDLRLYLKDEIDSIVELIDGFKRTLATTARENIDCVLPGYTHLQRAQPVLLSHHMLAYYDMLSRDSERLADVRKRTDVLPLGSGALAGSPYKLDRKYAAKLLGFSAITTNSLDGVSDRDFAIEFLSAASILMMHLSRLSEEIILWTSSEFGFIELSDAFCTGSSIMPQKKNPDIPELVRGKTGRVYGNLTTLLTVMKSLPLAYNKDMQEDKEPLFDTIDTVKSSLSVLTPTLATMRVNGERMLEATRTGFLTATDAADYLVKKGLPFRESHNIMGRVVAFCIGSEKTLEDMTLDEWRGFSELFEGDIRKTVLASTSVKSRRVAGGTALVEVKKRLKKIEKEI